MIKLIKKGTKLDTVYRATCAVCGSIWEAQIGDLKVSTHRNETCIQTENCAECGTHGLRFTRYFPS